MKKFSKLFINFFCLLLLIFLSYTSSYAVTKILGFTCLDGGTAGCMDAYDGDNVLDGDMGIVFRDNSGTYEIYFYRLEETAATEASPDIISPVTNAGDKRWRLLKIFGAGAEFRGTTIFKDSSGNIVITIPAAAPTSVTQIFTVAPDGTGAYLETAEGCIVGGGTGGAVTCLGGGDIWAALAGTAFPSGITDGQILCATMSGTVIEITSCGTPLTHTQPATGTPICATDTDKTGGCTNLTDVAAITASSTDELTNKTFNANGTGNVLKGYGYLQLSARAFMRRGAGVTAPSTTQTDFNFGLPKFADDVDVATNWIDWVIEVPADVDTAVDMTAKLSFYLGGADTADHDYVVSMCNPAASAAADCAIGDSINLAYTADGSGADGDVEYTAETTLTGWAAAVTAGRMWKIRLARDGDDGTNDASTVDSYPLTLTIKYGYTN